MREGAIVAADNRWDQGDADRSASLDADRRGLLDADRRGLLDADRRGSLDADRREGSDDVLDVLALVVHRLFGIGLEIQSAAGVADGPVAGRLQLVVDELDELIGDARSMAFERLRGPGRSG